MKIGRRRCGIGIALLLVCLSLTFLPLPSLSDPTDNANNPQLAEAPGNPVETAQMQIARLRQTANQLRLLATQPVPANVPGREREKLVLHGNWLRDAVRRMDTLADHWEQRLWPAGQGMGAADLTDLNSFFELQTVGLQRRLERENARYSTQAESTQPYYATTRLVIDKMR